MLDTCAFRRNRWRSRKNSGNSKGSEFGISEKCCILEKSRKNLVKFGENSAKFWQKLRNFGKKQQKIQQFLTKKLRLENGRMLLTWLLFRPRAPVVVLGSKLRLPMSSSWPVFPGLDQALSPPWFSWFLGFDSKTVQRSALCRSRRKLSNAYFLAKFGFDAADNERLTRTV